jgi:hypothetical protein
LPKLITAESEADLLLSTALIILDDVWMSYAWAAQSIIKQFGQKIPNQKAVVTLNLPR